MRSYIGIINFLEKVVVVILLLIFQLTFKKIDVCYGQSNNCNFLCNSNFESPGTVPVLSFGLLNQTNIPCWETTATDSMIEVWGSGFLGVNAYSGNNFIELNAYQVSTLYQNFTAPLGATTQISFAHRGRNGIDVMSVSIGPVGGPYTTLGTFSAGSGSWNYNTVNYTFPSVGSQTYSLRFNSISAAGNSQSKGNFLDAISVTYPAPNIDFIINEPTCNFASNGSIEAILTAGSSPYSYNWSPISNTNSNALLNIPVGNYSLTVTDFYGCTTTESIQLTASQNLPTISFTDTLCQGEVYVSVSGNIIDQSGIYYDTISNNQCDAVYIQNITILQNDTTYLQSTICQGDSLFFGNTYLNTVGVYENILQNLDGCDSIVLLNLTVNPSFNVIQNISACESFFWNGQTYTSSGQYNYLALSEDGCDSLVTLNLSINPSYNTILNINSCDSYFWNGQTYTTSGQYSYITISENGCDSLVTLNLTINPSYNLVQNISACDSYYWNGQTYTATGQYNFLTSSENGCDSLVILNLTINQSYNIVQNISACDSFFWNGQSYSTSGQYNFLTISENGCDSLVTLNLTINPSYNVVQNISACESYYWNGQTFTTSGQYTYLTFSVKGCDSSVTLNLTIYQSSNSVINVTECDSYFWNGQTYTTSGQYYYVNSNSQGCDSSILLNLQIYPSEEFIDTVWVCNDSEVNTIIESYQNSTGCDSTHITRYLLVPNEEQSQASFSIFPETNFITVNEDYQIINQSLFSDAYSWFFSFNDQWSEDYSPSISISEPGNYTIMLISNNSYDCPDTMSMNIFVVDDLNVYVPNSFTPDGNTFNNIFLPIISGDVDSNSYSLQIYNRWGNIVFESNNIYEGWDGTYELNDVQEGVYTWRIKLKSLSNKSMKEFTGHVVLLQ